MLEIYSIFFMELFHNEETKIYMYNFVRPSQAFYPCPPSVIDDEQQEFDPFDYLNTYVRALYLKIKEYFKDSHLHFVLCKCFSMKS